MGEPLATRTGQGARRHLSARQKYERGTNRISGAALVTACRVLKVDPNWLLGWTTLRDGEPAAPDDDVRRGAMRRLPIERQSRALLRRLTMSPDSKKTSRPRK